VWKSSIGSLRFEVDHRDTSGEGGATLRVRAAKEGDRELLRFDCFRRAPHYHVDPAGRDLITALDPLADNIDWTVGELARDLGGYLERAGFAVNREAPRREPLAALLRDVEAAMRNPPARLDAPEPRRLAARISEKWNTYPPEILPAWVAEMDFPLATPVRAVLERALDLDDLGYPINPGETGLREAFAERMETRFGWAIDPQRVVVLTDVVQGMYVALETLCEPGDGAIVQTPIYPPFLSSVGETGRRLDACPLVRGAHGFEIDFDALRAATDARTRMLLLCNPHNPSGRAYTREELEALAELVLERDLVVVADEIHADLVFDGRRHLPFASLGAALAERTITLTSATKAFNIPGLRCAVAHFGSARLQDRFGAVPRHIRGGVGLLGIYATLAAWRHADPWLDEVRAYLEGNRDFLRDALRKRFPEIVCHPAEATYLAWLDCAALELPGTPGAFFAERGKLALSDGHFFGKGWEQYARLNFATSRTVLEQVLERMETALRSRS